MQCMHAAAPGSQTQLLAFWGLGFYINIYCHLHYYTYSYKLSSYYLSSLASGLWLALQDFRE